MSPSSSRRTFLSSSVAVVAAATLQGQGGVSKTPAVVLPRPVALGFDNFAVRSSNWKAMRLLEYATTVGADSVLISDLDAFESLEEPALRKLREEATARSLSIHVGTWSVCPTSSPLSWRWPGGISWASTTTRATRSGRSRTRSTHSRRWRRTS